MHRVASTVALVLVAGCAYLPFGEAHDVDQAIDAYHEAACSISLGDDEQRVLEVLEPTQRDLPRGARKEADRIAEGASRRDVFYFRSSRQPDGLTTDDEFTPYLFVDGKLVAIGWTALGGPRSTARVPAEVKVQVHEH
jgi:hypothetical protein